MQKQGNEKNIKTGDIILILSIAAAAVLLIMAFTIHDARILRQSEGYEKELVILKDGETAGRYPLDQDKVIEISESNTCEICDGKVKMISADCPDQSCVRSGAISEQGETIICMPHRLILQISVSGNAPSGGGLDAVTY